MSPPLEGVTRGGLPPPPSDVTWLQDPTWFKGALLLMGGEKRDGKDRKGVGVRMGSRGKGRKTDAKKGEGRERK